MKRLVFLAVTLFGITVLTFILTRLTPGDPAALKIQGAAGQGAASSATYDDLVELNRRNLGLDKPLLLNFDFQTPETIADSNIDDLFRQADYWTRDAGSRLTRQSTIALPVAIRRLQEIGTETEAQHHEEIGKPDWASEEVRRKRLLNVMPNIALERPDLGDQDPVSFWVNYWEAKEEHLTRAAAEASVAQLGHSDIARRESRLYGGLAVPYLIETIHHSEGDVQWESVQLFQSLLGFSFVSTQSDFEERREEVLFRIDSFWRREKSQFLEPSQFSQAISVVANTQFGLWMQQALFFDFGDSYVSRRPVINMIGEALPVSLVLSGLSIFISYLIAIPLGIFSAVKRYTTADRSVTVILFVLYSLPTFWVAGLLLLTTTGEPFLNLFPARGLYSEGMAFGTEGVSFWRSFTDYAWHLALPTLCLTYGSLAFISRQMRSSMLETLHQDFIRTARAKGVSETMVIFKHAFRNSLIPILTISASLLPELIAGAVIIESIFTIPGMGTLTFEAIVNRDYPVVNAVLFFSALLTLLGILIADMSYAIADPRISYDD